MADLITGVESEPLNTDDHEQDEAYEDVTTEDEVLKYNDDIDEEELNDNMEENPQSQINHESETSTEHKTDEEHNNEPQIQIYDQNTQQQLEEENQPVEQEEEEEIIFEQEMRTEENFMDDPEQVWNILGKNNKYQEGVQEKNNPGNYIHQQAS